MRGIEVAIGAGILRLYRVSEMPEERGNRRSRADHISIGMEDLQGPAEMNLCGHEVLSKQKLTSILPNTASIFESIATVKFTASPNSRLIRAI